MRKYKFL